MKKVLLGLIFSLMMFSCVNYESAFAEDTVTKTAVITNWDSASSLRRINTVGANILAKNKLPAKIMFKLSEDETVNAYANINKEIYLQKGLLQYVESDDELAAVISHEVGHIVNAHIQKQGIISALVSYFTSKVTNEKTKAGVDTVNQLSMLKLSRTDEYESDLTGVDLMIVAGYNPLAMISLYNKILEPSFDFVDSHPSGDKRTMNIYDYLSYNYPSIIKKGYKSVAYSNFLMYAQSTVALRKTNPKVLAKFQKKQAKSKEARIKRAQKIRGANPWETTYSVLKTLSAY